MLLIEFWVTGEWLWNTKFLVERLVVVLPERYTLEQHLALLNIYVKRKKKTL